MTADVVVAGQLARDLVLVVEDVPEAGQSRPVRERREMLGGKGANQAVAVAQLGLHPALIAVAGDDEAGSRLLEQASRDGIDVSAVTVREGTATGLITDIVDAAGHWRYLENLPPSVLLNEQDVRAAAPLLKRTSPSAAWRSRSSRRSPMAVPPVRRASRGHGATQLKAGMQGPPPVAVTGRARATAPNARARRGRLPARPLLARSRRCSDGGSSTAAVVWHARCG
jgi:ribokinase